RSVALLQNRKIAAPPALDGAGGMIRREQSYIVASQPGCLIVGRAHHADVVGGDHAEGATPIGGVGLFHAQIENKSAARQESGVHVAENALQFLGGGEVSEAV